MADITPLQITNTAATAVCIVVGLFGNCNLIWIYARKRKLRTKSGLLLTINALFHSVSLLTQIINTYFILSIEHIERANCFPFMIHNIWFASAQLFINLVMAIDVLTMIAMPISYQHLPMGTFLIMVIFLLMFPTAMFCYLIERQFTNMKNKIIPLCTIVLALNRENVVFRARITNAVALTTLVIFVLVVIYVKVKGISSSEVEKRVISRTLTLLFAYLFTNFLAQILTLLSHNIALTPTDVQSFTTFLVLIAYSQNFYITIYKSPEYKKAFTEQMTVARCKKTASTATPVNSPPNSVFNKR